MFISECFNIEKLSEMKNTILKLLTLSLIVAVLVLTSNCKKDFDTPPIYQIPIGEVLTIKDLRQIFADSGQYKFMGDYSVYAYVTMGGASGNLYKSAYIQDTTGAVNLHLKAQGGVNAGDYIRVYLKNCILNSYGELLQIDNVDNDSSIIIQSNDNYIEPKLLTIPDLESGQYESYLIKLNDVQFVESDSGKTYADIHSNDYGNRILEDCNGNSVIVRTSSYANFAGEILPNGKGDIIAIAGKFYDDWQLYIRTSSEVKLTGPRCGGGGGGGLTQISVADLRAMFTGSATTIPDSLMIQAVITSDKDNENLTGNNAFIQETNGAGIVIRFEDWHDLPMGELVEINISGLELSEYNGLMQVNNIPLSRAKMLGQGTMPTPVELTIADLLLDFDNYEARLVKFSNVQITSSGGYTNYMYALNLNDGTGDIEMFTQSYATFANDNFPTGTVDITALVSEYDGPQVLIRNTNDVVETGGGGGGGSVDSIDEDFQGQTAYSDISIPDWVNTAVTGTRNWYAQEFQSNLYAQATSYNSNEANEMWLITVGINLDNSTNPVLEFESAQAYWNHDGLSVYISTDFDGSNIQGATWHALSCTLAGSGNSNYEYVPSGQISLASYSGVGYIGFKYIGDDNTGQTTNYIIDNLKVFDAK